MAKDRTPLWRILWHPALIGLGLLYAIGSISLRGVTGFRISLLIFQTVMMLLSLYNYFNNNRLLDWLEEDETSDDEDDEGDSGN